MNAVGLIVADDDTTELIIQNDTLYFLLLFPNPQRVYP